MSRLIVKNIPENTNETKLRELFSFDGGEITDLRLCYTKKGVFRKFAFIGYKTEEEATFALKALNKTYINTAKISVEKCTNDKSEEPGDEHRPWSKYSKGSSAFRRHAQEVEERKKRIEELQCEKKQGKKGSKGDKKKGNKDEDMGKMEKDPQFQEFLSLHMGKEKKSLWSNDDISLGKENNVKANNDEETSSDDDDDDEEENKDNETESDARDVDPKLVGCVTIKMRGIPFKSKEVDIINFFKPLKVKDIRFAKNEKGKRSGYAFVDFTNSQDMNKALKKDKEEMKGRYIELFPQALSENQLKKKTEEKEASHRETADVTDTGRLFIRNLSYSCTEEDLEKIFSAYGDLVEVNLPIDKNTNRATGFAFVTFMMPEHAFKAWQEWDGKIFQGRIMHVIPGREKKTEADIGNASYKKKKELEKKALSGSAHNWNALFLGQNAVADVMAERLNQEKHALLSGQGDGSVAVQMALGETELVNETQDFLKSHGVNLDVFGQASSARSKNVILAKNLPANTTQEELSVIFNKHGEIGRLLMPPYGITAIIEFLNNADAKKAFQSLAYSKFKHTPLYLEWAPVGTLTDKPIEVKEKDERKDENKSDSDDDDDDDSEGKVLFVKNLNFDTNEAKLKAVFSSCGKVKEATIAKKKDPKKDNAILSMGYGFVRFRKTDEVDKALANLQGFNLDGHKIELKRSHRETVAPKTSRKKAVNKKQTSTKIIVRNVPFEATSKEIKELFSSFGILKSVRLPKKMAGTGTHRGFAFVDFTTKQEAKRAFDSLCLSTHMYGRRLVLEWAEEEESVDILQKKTAKLIDVDTEQPVAKKKKFSIGEESEE